MLKRSLSPDTTDGDSVKAPPRNEPVVLAAADGGGPEMSTASPSEPLDESFLLRSPSRSRGSSQSLDESDHESYHSARSISKIESVYTDSEADDDDQDDVELDMSYQRVSIKIPPLHQDHDENENHRTFVYGVEDMDGGFGDSLRDYMLLVDAYPSVSRHDSVFTRICKQLFKVPEDEQIYVTHGVYDKYVKATPNCRAKLSLIFKAVMKTYTFDATTLPERCKKSRKRQFKYMMDAMRFARKDYLSSGAILQSAALGDVIAKVFYHGRKGIQLSLKDWDDQVPRPVIAFAFVFMYINMSLLCTKKREQRSLRGRDVGAIRASLYRNTLKGIYDNGEVVDWDEVQRVQTRRVRQNLESRQVSGPSSFGPMSATYEPKYQDGIYNSESDEE